MRWWEAQLKTEHTMADEGVERRAVLEPEFGTDH